MDLRVLGPFEVVDGGVLPLGGRRRRTLLARLALADGPLTYDRLLADLFDPPHDATARRLLRLHIDGLSELLGPGRVVEDDDGIALVVRPGESDAAAFMAESTAGRAAWHDDDYEGAASLLGGALERWRGQVLEDLAPLPWLAPIADRLETERTLARSVLGKVELAIERHGRVGTAHGLPAGVVSFLLTDIVDSTRRWEEAPDRMDEALVVHDELVGRSVAEHDGVLLRHRGEGDSTFSVFGRATDAVAAAATVQRRLAAAPWPTGCELTIRAGIHTGEAIERGGDYYGPTVNRAARIRAIAQPGWVALSGTTTDLVRSQLPVRFSLSALGPQVMKGIAEPEPVYLLVDAEAPAVPRTLDPSAGEWVAARARVPERAVPLTGRTDQLGRLVDALPTARSTAVHVALVAGDAGIGKTRLTAELADAAEAAGVVAAYGRCDDEVALPYQPVVAALGELVARAPVGLLTDYAREFGGELGRFVPALVRRLPWLPPPQSADAETERHLFFDAAAGLLTHLARDRPLLLVVDDLHWGERETLRLLRYVVEALAREPAMVVLAYRHAEVGVDTPLADLLGQMRRREDLTVLALTGLSGPDAVPLVELLTGRRGSAARHLAERVADETGGNPLFTLELLRHLVEQGGDVGDDEVAALPLPDSVRDVVERRVGRLGPAATELLQQAAVVGMSFDLDVLASTVDADADRVLDTLEQARRADLVEEVDGRFAFTHALVAHALIQGFSTARLQRLHLRVAHVIEELHGSGPGPYLSELAAHLVAAGGAAERQEVRAVARAAGEQALAGLAPEEAVRWYELALERTDDEGERIDALVELGVAQRHAAMPAHRETLLEAARQAAERGDAERLAAAALANARGDRSRTHFVDRDRVEVLERALAALGPDDSPVRARLLAQLAQETIHAPDSQRRLARADEALAIARRLGDPSTLADVLLMRYEATRVPHTLPARLAETAELVELAEQLGDSRRTAFAHMWRGRALLESGDLEGLDRHAQQAWALSEKVGSPYLRWNLISHFAHRAYLDGDLAEADRLAFECFAAGEGQPDARPVLASQLIAFRAAQGRLGEMLPAAEQDVARRPELVAVELALAWMYAQVGDPASVERATEILERHLADGFAGVRYDILWMQVMAYVAETASRLGHVAAATDLAGRLRPWADQVVWSGTIAMGPVSWLLGLLATTTGDLEEAAAQLAAARATSERATVPLWLAHVAVAEAGLAVRAGGDAGRAADEARAIAARHGFAEVDRDLGRIAEGAT